MALSLREVGVVVWQKSTDAEVRIPGFEYRLFYSSWVNYLISLKPTVSSSVICVYNSTYPTELHEKD